MSLDLLKRDLEERSFQRIYYFFGPEPYLKRFYLNSLISAVLGDRTDTDLHRYDGKTTDGASFSEELWLCPAGEYKLMLISDLPVTSSVSEFLTSEYCEIPEDTVVVVYQQTELPDLRTKSYKTFRSFVEKNGLMVEVQTVDDATLARWVAQQFRRRGCDISSADVSYFLSVEERNMESMLTEIDKIAAYCNGPITRDALELLCVKTVQARAYELNDLILEKNSDKVFAVWNDLCALRVAPQMILGSLFSCFANLYKLKVLEKEPESVRAELTKMKPFLVRKYAGYLAKIPKERLARLMDSCAEIDVLSKTTRTDPELLVVRLLTEGLELL
ncbi:MAG: DNA polymerase III subunit delta [Clostridia bacterium]|nr:DNA polymerase III subunit delta [Clostridia bacterium]